MPQRTNLYSDEAQAILGRAPSWVVRWGITVVFLIFAGIVIGCYFIKYPDTIEAPAVITTVNPPSDLVARYDGLIDTLCVKDKELVERGELIAVLHNAAERRDVERLSEHLLAADTLAPAALAASPWLDGEYALGELQSAFAEFQSRCRDYRHYLDIDYSGHKRRLLEAQIAKNTEYYDRLLTQRALLAADLDYGRRTLERDSLLLREAVISEADYETTAQNYLSKRNSQAGFDATLTSTELSILQTRQQLVELTLDAANERAEYERALEQSRQQLLAQIAQWREQYVITSPAEGRVSLQRYWSRNQHVSTGEVIASVVPNGELAVVGRMQVASASFGKVRTGQQVLVKLNGFPYMEFGVLHGTVHSISAVPEQQQTQSGTSIVYTVEVVFPADLRTTYRRELPLIQQMDGSGEIITDDMRLIEQFIRPIVSLFKNR
mgnify:CR=1 FL=1